MKEKAPSASLAAASHSSIAVWLTDNDEGHPPAASFLIAAMKSEGW
jgi:hypothetical protein